MSRTAVVIIVAVAALAAALVVLLVVRPFNDGPPIQTRALGVWQESTDSLPERMTVSSKDATETTGGGETEYWVTAPRTSDTPFAARLSGETILVYDEGGQDVLWSIVYDEGADALIVTRPGGGDTVILRRVSE